MQLTDTQWSETEAAVKWNSQGLIATIAQDHISKEVLMMAWMNAESLQKTVETNEATYWSRSRNQLWRKGESSGHVQKVKEIRLDCDGDTLLLLVEQVGGIACHTGREHCFFKRFENEQGWKTFTQPLKEPHEIY